MAALAQTSFVNRMLRAAQLDAAVYEEIEADQTATTQAALVVVLGSLAAGLGAGARFGLVALVVVTIAALAAWSFYAWITYWLGTGPLKGPATEADWGQVARTLGFANSPRLLLILGVVGLDAIVLVVAIWILVTTVVALRASLDLTTGRAVAVAIVGWLVQAVLTLVLIRL